MLLDKTVNMTIVFMSGNWFLSIYLTQLSPLHLNSIQASPSVSNFPSFNKTLFL